LRIKSIFRDHATAFTLLLIILFAVALRLYNLDYQSLWIDEIASMNGTEPELTAQAVINYSVGDQPPAFFLMLHEWFKIFPFTDFSGRLFALVIGIPGIVTVFFLGKEIKDNRTGLVSALITSINYQHIFYSQEVRFYTLLFFLSSLSYLFFLRAAKSARVLDFVVYTLSTTGLLYTHYYGLVVFASQGVLFVLLCFFYPVTRRFVSLAIGSAILTTLFILPWIPVFFSDAQVSKFWIPAEPFYFPIRYFYLYFKDVVSSIIFATIILFYFYKLYKKVKSEGYLKLHDFILTGWAFLSFLIPVVYSLIRTPMLQVRYTLIALPALIVMISLGLSSLAPRMQKVLIMTVFCTSLFSLIVIEQYYSRPLKEDWRSLVKNIIAKSTATDVIVSRNAWYCNYYFKTLHSSLRSLFPEQFSLEHQRPATIWWLDGVNTGSAPDPIEETLLINGYHLEYTDSLFRTRASRYTLMN
jgi:uncharacterized membrane protein